MEIPHAGQPHPERADAARNRRALLAAAHRIMAADGLDAVTMDRVAHEAGVGVGTVYRRFDDRSGLAQALLEEREHLFQAAFLSGPPPLGPGAPPEERLEAFLLAQLDRLETDADLLTVAQCKLATARYRVGAYQATRLHVVTLLRQAGVSGHVHYLADVLLATGDPGLFIHQRREQGLSLEEIKAGVRQLVATVLVRDRSAAGEPAPDAGDDLPASEKPLPETG